MKTLKAKVDLSGKAGTYKKGGKFEADNAYSEFLVNMGFAEEVASKVEAKEEVLDDKPKANDIKVKGKKDEGHK